MDDRGKLCKHASTKKSLLNKFLNWAGRKNNWFKIMWTVYAENKYSIQ